MNPGLPPWNRLVSATFLSGTVSRLTGRDGRAPWLATILCLAAIALSASTGAQVYNPDNAHFYELVNATVSWTDARNSAAGRTYQGLTGHLATIPSAQVQNFLTSNLGNVHAHWLGGYKDGAGNWNWITKQTWKYTNWGPGEPNNVDGDESCLMFHQRTDYPYGCWNDFHDANDDVLGYVVEYDAASISGTVTDSTTGAPLSGVTITITGSNITTRVVLTDSKGHYMVNALPNGGYYTVTAALDGYAFQQPFPFTASGVVPVNFVAYHRSIIGTIHRPYFSVSGITVNLESGGAVVKTAVTDASGNFRFTELTPGTDYTVRPVTVNLPLSKAPVRYDPPSRTYSNFQQPISGADFKIVLPLISGRIQLPDGTGVSGVTLQLTGGATTLTDTTGTTGTFSGSFGSKFNNLIWGTNYVLTPISDNYSFDPPSLSYPNFATEVLNANFVATQSSVTLYSPGPFLPSEIRPSSFQRYKNMVTKELYKIQEETHEQHIWIKVSADGGWKAADFKLRVIVTAEDQSGGHFHSDPNRPHGWLYTDAKDKNTAPPFGQKLNTDALGGTQNPSTDVAVVPDPADETMKTGYAEFWYCAPEIAGTEMLEVDAIRLKDPLPSPARDTIKDSVDVKIDGLLDLTSFAVPDYETAPWQNVTLYQFVGQGDNVHPSRFNGTEECLTLLHNAANVYIQLQQQSLKNGQLHKLVTALERQKSKGQLYQFVTDPDIPDPTLTDKYSCVYLPDHLRVNDGSLPWGGLFDDGNKWKPPHAGHRSGRHFDFRTSHLVWKSNMPSTAKGDPRTEFNVLVTKIHAEQYRLLKQALSPPYSVQLLDIEDAGATHFHVKFLP